VIGAIAGDIIGSVYEWHNVKRTDFPLFHPRCRFTDDTVLTVAVADAILTGTDYAKKFKEYCRAYPSRGYGFNFYTWAASEDTGPYNSLGNGSAMRVSPVAYARDTIGAVLLEAKKSAEATHNHPEGIRGAQAVASAVYLARTGSAKEEIKSFIEHNFGYDLDEPIDEIRKYYTHDVTCPGSVPQAIRAFLESDDFEDAVRKAISIGGDSDTIACIAGSIAHAYYGILPEQIKKLVWDLLDDHLKQVIDRFCARYNVPL
jgi:ADP-ribosylglycohydrolase